MTSALRLEMQRLLSCLCDGELSDAEHLRLEELLSEEADCRRVYLEYMDLHVRLISKSQLEGIHSPTTSYDESFPAAADSSAAKSIPSTRVEAPPATVRSMRGATLYQLFMVAVATLTATIMVQVFWWRPATPEMAPTKKAIAAPAKTDDSLYFATLRDAVDCVWDASAPPLLVGSRLKPGELQIPKGIVNVQFDSGPELVIEGPARLRLESSTSVTVLSGKVVLRADESAAPFDLHTPSSVLAEVGTELAVTVNLEGDEVHVFEGQVQRQPKLAAKGVAPEHLKAGEAWRFETKTNAPGKPTKCDPARFVRHVATAPGGAKDPAFGLLAYEGFDYRTPMAMTSPKGLMGKGWIGPWKAGFTRSFVDSDRPRFPLNSRESLTRPNATVGSVGGSFDYSGFTQYFRRLAKPMRLDTDGAYFLSFLFHRHGAPTDPINGVALQFWTHEDFQTQKFEDARQRLYVGIKKPNQATVRLQQMDSQAPLSLNIGSTYLLVAKITASRSGSDRVQMRVYAPDEMVDEKEPAKWSLSTAPFQSELVFDWVQLHINSKTRQTIDELRLGTTWSAVTTAYAPRTKP